MPFETATREQSAAVHTAPKTEDSLKDDLVDPLTGGGGASGVVQLDEDDDTPTPPKVPTSGMTGKQQDEADRMRMAKKLPALQSKNWTNTQWIKWHKAHNGAEWNNVKDSEEYDDAFKWEFWHFRKRYVDGLINGLRKKYPRLLAKSVGSQDLTSDYDLTIATPGGVEKAEDVEAMKEFNDRVKKDFGKQPGTVFDTNLYARDYVAVDENLDDEVAKRKGGKDSDIEQPSSEMASTSFVDQDVASLVKVRRYMSAIEYDKHMNSVLKGIDDKKEKAATQRQYEEADAIYQLGTRELLDATKGESKVDPKKLALGKDEQKMVDGAGKGGGALKAQLTQDKEIQELMHHQGDMVLEKSNDLYYKKMKAVRAIQALLAKETKKGKGADPDVLDSLKAQAKKAQADSIFFAAEAYHSEGAVQHIVAGLQGADSAAAIAALPGSAFLQSLNEQFGDFLKDCGHYADDPAGKLFYRSSKYLYRMFEAANELKSRIDPKMVTAIEKAHGNFATLAKTTRGGLVAIRKGEEAFKDDASKNAKAEKYAKALLGTSDTGAYKSVVMGFVAELNATARSAGASAQQSDDEVRKYHKHRAPPTKKKIKGP